MARIITVHDDDFAVQARIVVEQDGDAPARITSIGLDAINGGAVTSDSLTLLESFGLRLPRRPDPRLTSGHRRRDANDHPPIEPTTTVELPDPGEPGGQQDPAERDSEPAPAPVEPDAPGTEPGASGSPSNAPAHWDPPKVAGPPAATFRTADADDADDVYDDDDEQPDRDGRAAAVAASRPATQGASRKPEEQILLKAYERYRGNTRQIAQHFGVGYQTAYSWVRKLRDLGLV